MAKMNFQEIPKPDNECWQGAVAAECGNLFGEMYKILVSLPHFIFAESWIIRTGSYSDAQDLKYQLRRQIAGVLGGGAGLLGEFPLLRKPGVPFEDCDDEEYYQDYLNDFESVWSIPENLSWAIPEGRPDRERRAAIIIPAAASTNVLLSVHRSIAERSQPYSDFELFAPYLIPEIDAFRWAIIPLGGGGEGFTLVVASQPQTLNRGRDICRALGMGITWQL